MYEIIADLYLAIYKNKNKTITTAHECYDYYLGRDAS